MATDPKPGDRRQKHELIRPPVRGGTGEVESLGKFIDNLMGDARISRNVGREISSWVAETNSNRPETPRDAPRPLPDPPPAEAPEPVPGGTGFEKRERRPPSQP